jgi:glycosyltransferase involved in cell wall biosynthesis
MPTSMSPEKEAARAPSVDAPSLLVLDSSYTFEMIRGRKLEASVRSRDLGGFFRHVWSVHPFATLLTSAGWTSRFGAPAWHRMDARHTFIEGKAGQYRALSWAFALNFALAQILLFVSLLRLIRRERIQVIRAGDPLYNGLFAWALARLSGAIFVVRINGNNDKVRQTTGLPIFPRLIRSQRVEKWVERFVLRRTDHVFAPNADNAAFAVENGAVEARITVVSYGGLLSEEHFEPPQSRGTASDELASIGVSSNRFIMCIGRLIPLKFPDDVVRALGEVRARGHDIKAVLIGDGEMADDLRALARSLGAESSLVLAGNRDQSFLARVMPHALAVLSPCTGRALSEAALGAVPIIAYDIDWQRDLIKTDRTGVLLPPNDWRGMADAIERFIDNPDYARELGENVRDLALEMLNPEADRVRERETYEGLLRARVAAE